MARRGDVLLIDDVSDGQTQFAYGPGVVGGLGRLDCLCLMGVEAGPIDVPLVGFGCLDGSTLCGQCCSDANGK